MLRRPATTIRLTPEDILEYDDTLAQQQHEKQQQEQLQLQQQQQQQHHDQQQQLQQQEQINSSGIDLNQSFKPPASDARNSRIGVQRKETRM
ncbi:hypothetical protein DFJ63DRAFT_333443 [Scheffersomyces coipomensis]|uniref:uncharacterized protein n=1 Tax=Scheffersomyces coipomensis TaxID=1788519 RepID=UPI00315D74C0